MAFPRDSSDPGSSISPETFVAFLGENEVNKGIFCFTKGTQIPAALLERRCWKEAQLRVAWEERSHVLHIMEYLF